MIGGWTAADGNRIAIAFLCASLFNNGMTNRHRSLRPISSLLLVGYSCLLSGCIVMVVPAATSGLIAQRAVRHGGTDTAVATSHAAQPSAPPSTMAATNGRPGPSGSTPPSPMSYMSAAGRRTPEVHALVVPELKEAKPPPAKGGGVSTWYDVIQFEAKTALGTSDERRADVLRLAKNTSASCGLRPTAVLIDATTIGAGDYSYVGSLHTMGYVILLTSRSATLPDGQVSALVKEGIPVPHPGETLFPNSSGGDAGLRARLASRYCVVGLVGGQPGDFPGSVLPGAPDARPGWFLIGNP